ncbi:hypothetical protein MMUR_30330 [Mycolicibacterium murale]|uniref:DUF3043 domain-containing protein n=1 Tax=Mycolicibacterium murale TaxID=182220 RepID=A0A7I9WNV0_9MYCO|nr:DUF3043 domain-containing protein [Mycolicibacterium murale]MCV7184466.1 DUF3043 domain-containing protein [Mycolicibacterium murale]GFG58897.1 hypothetical protein MMUR_30330 [Mycolicibacterium murale]
MKLLGRKKDDGDSDDVAVATPEESQTSDEVTAPGTARKGRPTPKRDSAKRRGPVAPAPMTTKEARARRKAMAGPKLSKEERKIQRAERRASTNERRERMMAGDEAYLLPRDQGPVRRYARDIVDSRRNLLGLFMPAALFLIFVMLAVPQVQYYISPAMLVLMAIMAIDGILLARKVNNAVDVKFPDNTEGRVKLGFYAAGRASQLRRMRAPRPMVNRGDKVA